MKRNSICRSVFQKHKIQRAKMMMKMKNNSNKKIIIKRKKFRKRIKRKAR